MATSFESHSTSKLLTYSSKLNYIKVLQFEFRIWPSLTKDRFFCPSDDQDDGQLRGWIFFFKYKYFRYKNKTGNIGGKGKTKI